MNKLLALIIVLCSLTMALPSPLQACATCVGKLEGNTPPFFTKEYDNYFWPSEDNDEDDSGMANRERLSLNNPKQKSLGIRK